MTDRQVLEILASLNIVHVFKEGQGQALKLILSDSGSKETTSVTSFKGRFTTAIRHLEERKQEIRENKFAGRLTGNLGMRTEGKLNVEFLKRDDQLTRSEREEKKQLLRAVDSEIRHHRNVLSAMAVLQVRFKELQAEIDEAARRAAEAKAKKVWTRGVAAAAAFCNNQLNKKEHKGTRPVDICKDFLSMYTIQGEEAYTVDQLLNNVLQIRALNNAAR